MLLQPILGIVSFIGALAIFSSSFTEGNLILPSSVAAIILIEGLYNLSGKRNILKGSITIIASIALAASVFFRLPFYFAVIVGAALLVAALYDIFPTIIGQE